MIARLAVVSVIELVVLVLLALEVFGAPAEATPAATPRAPSSLVDGAPAAGAAVNEPRDGAPASPDSARSRRREIGAKWNADDPIGVMLTGTVRWSDGSSVEGAGVIAKRDTLRLASGGNAGTYAIVGLSPGEWQLQLRVQGGVAVDVPVTLNDDAEQNHDFVVERSQPVKVRVVTVDGTDGTAAVRKGVGHQFSALSVAARPTPWPACLSPAADGSFGVDAKYERDMNPRDGCVGTLHLDRAPAWVALLLRHVVLEQQVVQPGQSEVTFVVDLDKVRALAASATVRVIDAGTGQPIANAAVSLLAIGAVDRPRVTDADGRATVEMLPPGLLRCRITADGRETMYTTVCIEPGRRLDLGDVRLGPLVKLFGTLVDVDGKPVGGATISWAEHKWLGVGQPFATAQSSRSGADGAFELFGTGRGRLTINASLGQSMARIVTDNPPAGPVVMQLVPAVTCTIVWPSGSDRPLTVTVFDAQRRDPLCAAVYALRPESQLTMPAGSYAYEVRDDGNQVVQSGTLDVGASPTTLRIR